MDQPLLYLREAYKLDSVLTDQEGLATESKRKANEEAEAKDKKKVAGRNG